MLISYVRKKHLPKKLIKYNKKKHKKSKWITNGILRSITTKDKLYKIMIQTDNDNQAIFDALNSKR